MHFCKECSNMYYVRITNENSQKLVYYCRNCGYEDSTIDVNNVIVSSVQLKNATQEFSHIINKYTKLDPTMPRVSGVLCPNIDCLTNTDTTVEREILYIRYDDVNMRYVYLCATCDTIWKTETRN